MLILPARHFGQGTQPVERRVVSEQQWKKSTGGLDYSRDLPAVGKPQPNRAPVSGSGAANRPDFNWNTSFWAGIVQVLAILVAVTLIGYGIYRMLQEPRNRLIARDGAEITVENLETYLHETDLSRFLNEALAQQNYPLAIRLYFLQIIKALSQNGAISWSKEKTNRDYLREMRAHRLSQPFGQATRHFERIWYGNAPLDAGQFARLEPEFRTLLTMIHSPIP